MSLIDFEYFVFLAAVLVLYYLPIFRKFQSYILLFASIYFYRAAMTGRNSKFIALVLFMIFVPYVGGLLIEKTRSLAKDIITFLSVSALISALFVLQDASNVLSQFLTDIRYMKFLERITFSHILGVSYYTLSAVGYLLDVKWEMYKAEKNPAKTALFILFFPLMISGPVVRYSGIKPQIYSTHKLEYENISFGLQRMLWGYFKKLIISERFAIIVLVVYRNYESYNGFVILFATLCYAVQLYTDFSGCMDIIIGAARLFGITLPENFNAPFFSRSLREFWRRWHITLGLWFKDYVMFAVQRSNFVAKAGKYFRNKLGKQAGKKAQLYISMFALWFLIGIWHGGTAYYFIASGMIPFLLLVSGDILSPLGEKIITAAGINTESIFYKFFQRLRTILFVCISFVFVCSESVNVGIKVFARIFTNFLSRNTAEISLAKYINMTDICLMILGITVLFLADYMQDKNISPANYINQRSGIIQYGIYYAAILMIMFFGMTGNSSFIYFQF